MQFSSLRAHLGCANNLISLTQFKRMPLVATKFKVAVMRYRERYVLINGRIVVRNV